LKRSTLEKITKCLGHPGSYESPIVLGDPLLKQDTAGKLLSTMAEVYPLLNVIITGNKTHGELHLGLINIIKKEIEEKGLDPLTQEESSEIAADGVAVMADRDNIYIRPNGDMNQVFKADEILEKAMGYDSRPKIKIQEVLDDVVRQAIRERGESWRMTAIPKSTKETIAMIKNSRIELYEAGEVYYNRAIGTRYITFNDFSTMGLQRAKTIRESLIRIAELASKKNKKYYPELSFFKAEGFGSEDFKGIDFNGMSDQAIREKYNELKERFKKAVGDDFQKDDYDNPEWIKVMFSALTGKKGYTNIATSETIEEDVMGLRPEFYMHIQWLPGARIEKEIMLPDPLFIISDSSTDEKIGELCDERVPEFINYFSRQFGQMEWINIGKLHPSLSGHSYITEGRRLQYIAVIKVPEKKEPIKKIIKMQKWGVVHFLDQNCSLEEATLEAMKYSHDVGGRWVAFRDLGAKLIPLRQGLVQETYDGINDQYKGQKIISGFIERDYIDGIATDKIPEKMMKDHNFAIAFAQLLGMQAATNMIAGRTDNNHVPVFDEGNEILVLDKYGLPSEIVVSDFVGVFKDYQTPDLTKHAEFYSRPILKRRDIVPDMEAFANAYCLGITDRIKAIQLQYRKAKLQWQTMFRHLPDEEESIRSKWEKVCHRLENTDAQQIGDGVKDYLNLVSTIRRNEIIEAVFDM
jgi:hypothetical protein